MTPVSPSLHTCLYSGARLRLQDLAGPLENAEELSRNFSKGKKQGGHVDIYIYIRSPSSRCCSFVRKLIIYRYM